MGKKNCFGIKKRLFSKSQNTLGSAISALEILSKEKSCVYEDDFQEKIKGELGPYK